MEHKIIWELIAYLGSLLFLPSVINGARPAYKWLCLGGNLIFIVYGIVIAAYPVCAVNIFIAIINIVYLAKRHKRDEIFKILQIQADSEYLKDFLEYNRKDIFLFFPNFRFMPTTYLHCFLIFRNINISGLFITSIYDENTLKLELDYVVHRYRDYRTGEFLYQEYKYIFTEKGYTRLISPCYNRDHEKYLKRMGFELQMIDGIRQFVKKLD